jgi:hypothetical protein
VKRRSPVGQSRMQTAAQRNENVPIYAIDNNAIKEANVRLGTVATLVNEPRAESSYFATEFGRPASAPLIVEPPRRQPSWHAELYQWHQNSILNARAFFQVGDVQPARRNHYGGRATADLGKAGYWTAAFSQRKIRGMVNGNVLVPLPEERVPLATDPAVRALIQRFLDAFPIELPNRTDFDPRALNTNAPQRINDIDGTLRLDKDVTRTSRFAASYTLARSRTEAFQLVAGQNPDTEIHSHRANLQYQLAANANTDASLGATFQRVASLLAPEPNAVGPRVRFGYQWRELGPDSEFPVDRAQNSYRYGGQVAHRAAGGRHTLLAGADLVRFQLNGIETNNLRGQISFTNNFGRTAMENALLGTPSFYEVTIGELARGFRTWTFNAFLADNWKVSPKLQLYLGLRYNLATAPTEVNNYNEPPYACDCNNVAPRVALAWSPRGNWTVRSSYAISFAPIQPVTYQQIRNNAPHVRFLQIQNPDLLDPLRGFDLTRPETRTSPTFISSDLVAPYAHQYNLSFEKRLDAGSTLRLGYVGSRTIKLLNAFIENRAEPIPGIPLTLATVDERRPDPRYFEVRRVLNGGVGYYDAAIASYDLALPHGVRAAATYTFSKAIDEGPDFTSTAANGDMLRGRSQWQYESFRDKKGRSNFDAPHALLIVGTWDLPFPIHRNGWMRWLLDGWQASGVSLLKQGTPYTLYVGSDAPGFGNVDGGPSDRPSILDPSILGSTIPHPDVAPEILGRERFAYIQPGEMRGSVGRNTFRKARIANLNAALNKRWNFGGQREWLALFRVEAYNLTNTPQFDEPQRNLTSPSFGRITNTLNDGRVFQVGLRLVL